MTRATHAHTVSGTEDEAPPASGTWIEIDETALRQNLRNLRQLFDPSEYCMVVKGNAYGHGYDPVIPIAEAEGVRKFAVFSAREAHGFLHASDGKSRLMIMGHADHENLPWIIENHFEPWLNDSHDWPLMKEELHRCGDEPLRVHLEVETGMNRTGLPPDEAFEVAQAIHAHPKVELEGVCTHLAGAEDKANGERIARQKKRYWAFLHRLDEAGIPYNKRHIASSAAALLDKDCRLDLVRVGIASYGLWPSQQVHERGVQQGHDPKMLRNVLAWKSRIVACKGVEDGDFVGYGMNYEAEGDMRIGVVAVGYGDGFARDLSNRGYVLIRGKRASIVGHVNMNMVQTHITHIPGVQAGDEVVLVGRQGERDISVASFSEFNNVVNYELMARLSWEIPRLVVRPRKLQDPLE